MTRLGRSLLAAAATAGVVLGAIGVAGRGSALGATPGATIDTFLAASARGDAATACSQLSPQARVEVIEGVSCAQGIRAGAGVYGSIIKQMGVSGLTVQGTTAIGTSMLNGRPTASFRLRKQDGGWLIVEEHRLAASPSTGAEGSGSSGPTEPRVEVVAGCLDKTFGLVDNSGLDSTGGTAHTVLTVDTKGSTAAEINVFASALAALSGYKPIQSYEAGRTTTLASASVIVYFKELAPSQRRALEACG